ncbi:MAG: transposase [Bacteroidales bacterium]|nr:transposase [Bacteroidales bacterium]
MRRKNHGSPFEKEYERPIMSYADKIMLRKRSIIEIINDELKNICHNILFKFGFV